MGPIKESGSQPPEIELRSSDPPSTDSLKAVNGSDATVFERSPDVVAEGEALVSPQPLGTNLALSLHACLYLDFDCMKV